MSDEGGLWYESLITESGFKSFDGRGFLSKDEAVEHVVDRVIEEELKDLVRTFSFPENIQDDIIKELMENLVYLQRIILLRRYYGSGRFDSPSVINVQPSDLVMERLKALSHLGTEKKE